VWGIEELESPELKEPGLSRKTRDRGEDKPPGISGMRERLRGFKKGGTKVALKAASFKPHGADTKTLVTISKGGEEVWCGEQPVPQVSQGIQKLGTLQPSGWWFQSEFQGHGSEEEAIRACHLEKESRLSYTSCSHSS
jgi:hypothetical protein